MKTNFHTHTERCKHAVGTDEEYVLAAIEGGFSTLGISDHAPWPSPNAVNSNVSMEVGELPEYIESITELRARYAHSLDIKLGLECEYLSEFPGWLDELAARDGIQYLIFGNHFDCAALGSPYFGHETKSVQMLRRYEESVLRGMEYKYFAYLAHPDLFMRSYEHFDAECERVSRRICEKAAKLNLPLEYNTSGYNFGKEESYPHESFWKIAKYCNCVCIIGVDAHDPKRLANAAEFARAEREVSALGLKRIDSIELLR